MPNIKKTVFYFIFTRISKRLFDNTLKHKLRNILLSLDTNEQKGKEVLSQSIEYFDGSRRPVCFVYSGMGSQWPGMGAELLRIPIFASAVER